MKLAAILQLDGSQISTRRPVWAVAMTADLLDGGVVPAVLLSFALRRRGSEGSHPGADPGRGGGQAHPGRGGCRWSIAPSRDEYCPSTGTSLIMSKCVFICIIIINLSASVEFNMVNEPASWSIALELFSWRLQKGNSPN